MEGRTLHLASSLSTLLRSTNANRCLPTVLRSPKKRQRKIEVAFCIYLRLGADGGDVIGSSWLQALRSASSMDRGRGLDSGEVVGVEGGQEGLAEPPGRGWPLAGDELPVLDHVRQQRPARLVPGCVVWGPLG